MTRLSGYLKCGEWDNQSYTTNDYFNAEYFGWLGWIQGFTQINTLICFSIELSELA